MYLKLTKDNIYKYISEYDIKIINNNINYKIKSYLFINITNDLQNVWLMINKNYILYVSNITNVLSKIVYRIILLININNINDIKFTIYSNIYSKVSVLYNINKTIRIAYNEDYIHMNKDGYNDKFIYSNYVKICNYKYINYLYYKYKYKTNHNKIIKIKTNYTLLYYYYNNYKIYILSKKRLNYVKEIYNINNSNYLYYSLYLLLIIFGHILIINYKLIINYIII